MAEPKLSEVTKKLDGIAATLKGYTKRFENIEKSIAGTDATVTALYAELVGSRPNLRDRLTTLEANVHKLIELTPSAAAELKQPIYDT
jgi:hypothetical protein